MEIVPEFTSKGVHGPIDRIFHPKTHVITKSLDDRLKNVMLRTLSDVKLIAPIPKESNKDKYRDLTLQYISPRFLSLSLQGLPVLHNNLL